MTAPVGAAAAGRRHGLDATVVARAGSLDLDVALAAAPATVTAVLGPNGAGKTTLLRCLAGLTPLAAGRVVLDGRTLEEPPRTRVPTEHRRLGIVHQDYLLFPHLTALENVAFGLRSRGVPATDARRAASAWLDRVGMADRSRSRPGALSGGQQQRVALARALAARPRALLLDEPLAALDARTRPRVRHELREHLRAFDGVTLLVTHDLADAVALADRVVVVEGGRATHAGPVAEVTRHPRTDYMADLTGTTLLRGVASSGRVRTDGVELPAGPGVTGPVLVAIRRDRLDLRPASEPVTPRHPRWDALVTRVDVAGDTLAVHLDRPVGAVASLPPGRMAGLGPGARVAVTVDPGDVVTYPA